ncbi:MAG: cyclic beta 1-2 glucan synthetase, partial [Verrucomicrobia bacterium]
PTNIGLSLLSSLAAWDFGYIPTNLLLQRTENTFTTLEKLERHRGHFYNWYETRSLRPLFPRYVSTVDNGNLVGHLYTLEAGLTELSGRKILSLQTFSALQTTLRILIEEVQRELAVSRQGNAAKTTAPILSQLGKLDGIFNGYPASLTAAHLLLELLQESANDVKTALASFHGEEVRWWSNTLVNECRAHLKELEFLAPWIPLLEKGLQPISLAEEVVKQLDTIPTLRQLERLSLTLDSLLEKTSAGAIDLSASDSNDMLAALQEQCHLGSERAGQRREQIQNLARRCAALAEMDFTILYDSSRELFSIGYNVSHNRMDSSCYDLLASEARLISYVAVALGQLKQEHWFALGRLLITQKGWPTLVSWSGSMFEYLMPLLVMPTYENTLLDTSCKGAVARQIEYGKQRMVPWGFSESGYYITDVQLNYQYRAFGAPGLGLKRGLGEELVVAPYASALALMVAPEEASQNLERLAAEGREGRFGFYEAIDYTPSRVPPNQTSVTVQSFMAHHQGMSLLAFAYVLLDRPMQRRFQANPLFRANELLLQERVPKRTTVLHAHELEIRTLPRTAPAAEATMRAFRNRKEGPPEIHLLSNGRYHTMVTQAGGSYGRWNDIALTRWREDPTRDCWGMFLYLRDVGSGELWSATYQPLLDRETDYETIFSQGRAEFRCRHGDIHGHLQICLSPEDDVEVRHLVLDNRGDETRTIELTSFAEVALNTQAADCAHPAFSKLFVQTQILPDRHAILCSRRPRSAGDAWPWIFHLMLVDGTERGAASFETDRAQFLGRGRTARRPAALARAASALSNSEGSILDPCVAIRRTLRLAPKEQARLTLITGVAADQQAVQALVEKYQDIQLAERVIELSWTHGLVVLRHLNATEPDAQLYGRLASGLLYSNNRRWVDASILAQNRRGQSSLWSYGISGDLPIVLLNVNDMAGLDLARQLLQAHAYWRLKGLAVDLVILNSNESGYRQALHDHIMGLVASGIEAQLVDKPGGIFVRRLEHVPPEDRILLQAVARVALSDDRGSLAEQLDRRWRLEPAIAPFAPTRSRRSRPADPVKLAPRELIFFNGLGGFTRDGREYVMILQPNQATPAPWVNVIANPYFGTVISESGSAYTWAENSHEFRLTPWHNDPVSDLTGEAFYIRDEQTGQFWSPAPLPARGKTPYVARHGFGYSVFEHTENGIASELWIYVGTDAPVKFAMLKLRNQSGHPRALSVTGYWEWVLGELRHKNLMHVVTEIDPKTQALMARNPFNTDFADRMVFVDVDAPSQTLTGDREEFLGRNNCLEDPRAMRRVRLSGKVGAGLDPCGALQVKVELARDEEREIIFRLGAAPNLADAQQLIQRFRGTHPSRTALESVWHYWNRTLGAVNVETPEPALNVLANGWLVYQTLAGRMWARTGYYQSGGAFGFRDQLQDAMALGHCEPALVREHLLRAAAHQFHEGDVQHWWHPPNQRGVRTRFSDDYLWLPYATCHYVRQTGDMEVLEERVPFLEGRSLKPEEEAYYDLPRSSGESLALYEHCVRAVKNGLRFGEHGLPLMGCGDWNDGMNLVGIHGRGESVWLAFFLYDVLNRFGELARERNDAAFAGECASQAAKLRENIERHAWDGQWYRRAYFDNGEPLGSSTNPECQIDSLPQSWSIMSGAGQPERSILAMNAVDQRLVRPKSRLIQLFDPPFDHSSLEPGYIKGYVPGVRENGGQYTHAAVWTIIALSLMGEHQRAWELFLLINPILHADTPKGVARYKVEPYVVAADVYAVHPHAGRGGWTWYTG